MERIIFDFGYEGTTKLSVVYPLADKPDPLQPRSWHLPQPDGSLKTRPLPPHSGDGTTLQINAKQPKFQFHVHHEPPGLLGEAYPTRIEIRNGEQEPMRAVLGVVCKNEEAGMALVLEGEDGGKAAGDGICVQTMDGEGRGKVLANAASIADLDIGVIEPGCGLNLLALIRCESHAGVRSLLYSINFRPVKSENGQMANASQDFSTISQTCSVSFSAPFDVSFKINETSGLSCAPGKQEVVPSPFQQSGQVENNYVIDAIIRGSPHCDLAVVNYEFLPNHWSEGSASLITSTSIEKEVILSRGSDARLSFLIRVKRQKPERNLGVDVGNFVFYWKKYVFVG